MYIDMDSVDLEKHPHTCQYMYIAPST